MLVRVASSVVADPVVMLLEALISFVPSSAMI